MYPSIAKGHIARVYIFICTVCVRLKKYLTITYETVTVPLRTMQFCLLELDATLLKRTNDRPAFEISHIIFHQLAQSLFSLYFFGFLRFASSSDILLCKYMAFLGFHSRTHVQCLFIFLFCSLPHTYLHAFSQPFQDMIANVQDGSKDLDYKPAIQSRGAEDLFQLTSPSSTSSLNFLNEEQPAIDPKTSLESNILDESDKVVESFQRSRLTYSKHYSSQPSPHMPSVSGDDETDQSFPIEDSGNAIQHKDSQKLALLDGEGDSIIPIKLPSSLGGSGEMDYGDPSVLDFIKQFSSQPWRSWFDPKKQTKPKCMPRAIRYGGPNMLFDMFPFCCEKAATYKPNWRFDGDEEQRRESFKRRQVNCDECKFCRCSFITICAKLRQVNKK